MDSNSTKKTTETATHAKPNMLRRGLFASLVGLTVCAATLLVVRNGLPLLPTDSGALAQRVLASDVTFYMRAKDLTSSLLPADVLASANELTGSGGTYETVVFAPAGDEERWAVRFTPNTAGAKAVMLYSAPSVSGSVLTDIKQANGQTLAELSEFRRYVNPSWPSAAFFRPAWLKTDESQIGKVTSTALSQYDFIVANWNDSGSGSIALTRTAPQQSSGFNDSWPATAQGQSVVLEDASFTDRLQSLEAMLSAADAGFGEGVRGIVLQRWQEAFGKNASPSALLTPLLSSPARLEVEMDEGEMAMMLQGRIDDPKALETLLNAYRLQTSSATVRTQDLGKNRRTDVIADPQAGTLSAKEMNGWTVTTVTTGSGKDVFGAVQGRRYILTNNRQMLESAAGMTPAARTERAVSRGSVDLLLLRELVRQELPFLLPDESALPWSLLQAKQSLSWSAAAKSDALVVNWEARWIERQ